MATTTATMTGSEFDALPYEEGRRWELLEGDLIPVSSPTLDHQEIVYRILSALKQRLADDEGVVSHDVEFALADDTRTLDALARKSTDAASVRVSSDPQSGQHCS